MGQRGVRTSVCELRLVIGVQIYSYMVMRRADTEGYRLFLLFEICPIINKKPLGFCPAVSLKQILNFKNYRVSPYCIFIGFRPYSIFIGFRPILSYVALSGLFIIYHSSLLNGVLEYTPISLVSFHH
jgi:hypothetical protein